jgi:F-type H+-transporting ATPase subunit a
MNLSPDTLIFWQSGSFVLSATLLFTWIVMLLLGIGSWLVTRHLSTGIHFSRWQNLLEVLVSGLRDQIQQVSGQKTDRYLPFIGTLFIFIATSDFLEIVPGFRPPTSSLSTTAALAMCVFLSVPLFGIQQQGIWSYLRHYFEPTPIMFPFLLISEFSRTLALAVRLFGNVMSGGMIVTILLSIAPLFFPILMQALSLIMGLIQAYIFAILAIVYIASGMEIQQTQVQPTPTVQEQPSHE